jgi:hypothetical protein
MDAVGQPAKVKWLFTLFPEVEEWRRWGGLFPLFKA